MRQDIINVVAGAIIGGISGFILFYLAHAFFLGDGAIFDFSMDTGTGRPSHQFRTFYLTVKYINLVVGVSAGAIIGSIAGGVVSVTRRLDTTSRF